jgi:hypothetical protein
VVANDYERLMVSVLPVFAGANRFAMLSVGSEQIEIGIGQ